MIIDLHTHTRPGSYDSSLNIVDLISRARRAGIDGICFTEHDRFWNLDEVAKLEREYDFPIFPGSEIDTEEGHIIVLGPTEYRFGMHRAAFIRELLDREGGVMILSHPYRRWFYYGSDIDSSVERVFENPVFKLVDTVESMNGRGNERQNSFSIELGRKLGCTWTERRTQR